MTSELNQLFQHKETSNEKSENIRLAIDQLFSNAQLEQKTVLSSNQIYHLAKLAIYAYHYNDAVAFRILEVLQGFAISTKGRGRDDLREALKAALFSSESAPIGLNLKQRLLGF